MARTTSKAQRSGAAQAEGKEIGGMAEVLASQLLATGGPRQQRFAKADSFSPGNKLPVRASHSYTAWSFSSGAKGGRPAEIFKQFNIRESMKKQLFAVIVALGLGLVLATSARAGTGAGAGSAIPAYYDGTLFTIQFVEFTATAEQSLLQHNGSLNFIYQSDPGLPGGQPFISVIDAIPTDGFNPVWEEVQIAFTKGHTPHQFFSDDQVLAAANSGEITLTFTGEVYWCPVVGTKP